jgi:mono/diheme cytochrome c family protein
MYLKLICNNKQRNTVRGRHKWRPYKIYGLNVGTRFIAPAILLAFTLLFAAACRQDMHDQPKYEPLEQNAFYGDQRASREPVPGTVARGQLNEDEHLYTGKINNQPVHTFPMELNAQIVKRGQERYNIFCGPCHDQTGQGAGMVVQRGFKRPPSFHIQRLQEAPVGYYYDVITNGFGVMASYAPQVPPEDRWAIIAYIRALQLSQNATVSDVPEQERKKLEASRGAQ